MAKADCGGVLGDLVDLPSVATAQVVSEECFSRFVIGTPRAADYRFELHVHEDGEPQICAFLVEDPEAYFWYMPFEAEDFPDTESQNQAFRAAAIKVLSNRTVILQTRGLLWDSFTLYVHSPTERTELYSVSGLRMGGFRGPTIRGRRREYTSPAADAV